MWKLLLNASLLAVALAVLTPVVSILLLLVSGEGCVGHGICDLGVVAWLGVLYGPAACIVCLPLAASVRAADPTLRTRIGTAIFWSGVVFLVITAPVALYLSFNYVR